MEEFEGFVDFLNISIIDSRNPNSIRTFTGVKIRPALDGSGYFIKSMQDDSVTLYITDETYQQIMTGKCNTVNI